MNSRNRFSALRKDGDRRFDFEKLEDRNLLSGTSELIHIDLSQYNDFVPVITAGDPNGTPPITPDGLIDPNVPTSPFAGTVALNPNGTNVCTGSVISTTHILTAGHCVDFNDDGAADISLSATEVHFNHIEDEIVYTGIAEIIVHPDYTGFANPTINDDIAILVLNDPIPAGVPIYNVNTTPWTESQLIFPTGYGTTGDAANGYSFGSAGHDIKRTGQNVTAAFEFDDEGNGRREIFLMDMDGPDSSTDALGDGGTLGNDIEVFIGGGDSGGPSFIWDDGNGDGNMTADELRVFGVNTFTGGGGLAGAPFFGSRGGGMNVHAYLDFVGPFITSGEIDVTVDGESIPSGSDFNFGVTSLGDSITKTFTVSNSADTTLTLSDDLFVSGNYTLVSGFGDLELETGESTDFTVRFEATRLGTFDGVLQFGHSDRDESPFRLNLTGAVAGPIGEAGLLNVSNRWQTVSLDNTYHDPVIVAGPVSSNEVDPAVVRIRIVKPDSFQIRVQEWQYLDGPHIAERISYVVMERGVHRLSTGQTVVAGIADSVDTGFSSELFALPFDETPVVVASAMTYNGGAPITTRLHNVTKTGFQVMVQEEEAADNKHNDESVGYLAFIQEEGTLGGLKMDAERTGRDVDEDLFTLSLDGGFADPPVFLATMQTTIGTNTASLRMTDITNSTATVFVEEEQSRDVEIGHGNEVVGFFAIEAGEILGRTVVGESMHLTVDRDWQTVSLAQSYIDPVVIAASNTMHESDPLTVRVRNITNNSFQIHIEEWNYLDLDHAEETVSVMVFESGIHQLRDGTLIEARNSRADLNWTSVELTRDYGEVAPAVFTQLSSDEGPATATIRTRNVGTGSFEIMVQEEEANKDGHVEETVSWVAVHGGAGFSGGLQYDVMHPTPDANHKGESYTFDAAFSTVPVAIASMQTTRGTNTATVRQTEVTRTGIDLFIEEEQSFDRETGHGREEVVVFAVEPGILDGVLLEFFEDDGGSTVPPTAPTSGGFRTIAAPSASNSDVQQMLSNSRSLDVASIQIDSVNSEPLQPNLELEDAEATPVAGAVQLEGNDEFEFANSRPSTADSTDDVLRVGELDEAFETLF